ncbi:MAG: PAS domain S-box protein [Actinobacteria bacterium]|nr:PAS domain S-box protein [Actinomycetota bacterium]
MLPGTIRKLGGLRVRLVVLVLIAALPAIGLATYAATEARQDAVLSAQHEATHTAESLGDNVDRYITQSRQVLSAVAAAPVVQHGSPEEISDFLADVHADNPEFSTLLVAGPDGRVIASATPLTGHPDLSDRGYWKQIQETHAFSVGSYSVGRVTGEPVLPMGQPILADDGSLRGVVVTGIKLEVLGTFTGSANLPAGADLHVVDRNGVMLMRYPDPGAWSGEGIEELALGELMLSGGRGSAEILGPDGVTRLYSYAPVPGPQRAVFVSVGIPRNVAYATVSKVVFQFSLGMAIVVLFVTLAAWLGAGALVLRPIRRLVTAAEGLGSGDLSIRVGAEGGSGEIGRLARVFDSMAETLERRTEALTGAEARYRTLVESSPTGIVVHLGGQVLFANEAAARIVGASVPADLVGLNAMEFVHPDYRDLAHSRIEEAFRTGEATELAEERFLRLDGSEVDVEVLGIPLVFGETTAMNTIIRDISDRKRAEKTLRESHERAEGAQRLEAVGRLAGGVAHDFNNLLTAIIGYADLGQEQSKGDPALREVFDEIGASADRAATLTRQLLAFSRRQPLQPRVVDLNVVTESISGLLRRLIGEDAELALRCEAGLWPVEVDPGQIEQLITNLVINARDAMPGGGKLTIETANVELGEAYASTHLGSEPGPHVMLAVSDTGTGIDPEILPHVFEPFFTTKGTGLGLSTVYGIVKQSRGNIWVYSEAGRGTTFKVYFPRVDKVVDWLPEGRPASPEQIRGGEETILVVEDEEVVRALTVRILEAAGYTVLQEGDPREALKLYDEYGGVVHLLLTDVVLPGMSGRALADSITAKQGVPPHTLFMSGYTQNAIVHDGRLDPGVDFLEKPFTPDGLLRKVRAVLDRLAEGQLEMPV